MSFELVRLVVRRDRVRLTVWLYVLVATVLGTAATYVDLYPTLASRERFARSVAGNGGVTSLIGEPFDLTTIGGLVAWRLGGFMVLFAGLMGLLTVVRHTRAEEEAGRRELIGAGAVARHAPLGAVLAVVLALDLAIGLIIAGGMIAFGEAAAGSLALGLSIAAGAACFAAVAALAAQLTESARAASGLASGALGLAFVLRAAGDGGPHFLSWLSPIGWAQQVRPYAGERWWVLALPVAFTAAAIAGAYTLEARRDLGSGLFASRPGPAVAGPRLHGPFGLAWRLQRGALLGWAGGLAALGFAVGAVAYSVGDLVRDNRQLDKLIDRLGSGGSIVDSYLASVMSLSGLLAAACAVQAVLRLRGEETSGRAEPLLATALPRLRWAASHIVLAVIGPALALVAAGGAAGLVHGLREHDVATQLGHVLEGALVQLPAAWAMAGLALALVGLVPRWSALGWGAVVAVLLIGQVGPLLDLPQAIMDVSPFTHVPKVPGDGVTAGPLLALVAVAVALGGAGLAGLRRRDLG